MVKRDWKRAAWHTPHGVVVGLLCLNPLTWRLAGICWRAFRAYEENEDNHIGDQAWHDYFGFCIGIGIVALLAIPAGIILILKLIPAFISGL